VNYLLTFGCKDIHFVVNKQIVEGKISTFCRFLTYLVMNKSTMLANLINYYSDGNQAKFAEKLGIPAQNISAWLKRNTFNAELIFSKCEGVSAEWLLSGEGEMLKEERGKQIVDAAPPDQELLKLCKTLVENYQQRDNVMSKLVSLIERR